MITIITTTLNSEKYIRDTIESILNQNYDDLEYIIVDGGSEDRTADIISEYDDIQLLEYPGSSMYEAIDYGIRNANGEIVSWLNSDDMYKEGVIPFVVDQFKKSNINILTGSVEYVDKEGDLLYPYYYWVANTVFIDVFKDLLMCQPSTFFTKELYLRLNGFNMDYKIVADRDFFIRAFRNGKVKTVVKPLSKFRVHGSNLSTTKRDVAITENRKINQELKAGPKGFKNKVLYYVGHFLTKVLNPKMIFYKVVNGKKNILLD